MSGTDLSGDYQYHNEQESHTNAYLLGPVLASLAWVTWAGPPRRVFDLGCGNGAVAAALTRHGYEVVGVDPSQSGIEVARKAHPHLSVYVGSAYDDLAGMHGRFPALVSLEVVEHVFFPRKYAACVYSLLEPGGTAIISTPYHGYWKNLALALTGKLDRHFSALWDYGHIKFWSFQTLSTLLREAGFADITFLRVGRVPPLAKSMIAIARRPTEGTKG
jgi:2-polyprenyl-6-hydroxyphenyl methylase/3-demethylubiquinone-9 3-methyltransferase